MSLNSENVIKSLNISASYESQSLNEVKEKFKERIRTFVDGQKWVRRPLVLSPDICSQYGWKCVKSDLLQCVTCSAKLCTHEPNMENIQAYEECIRKILTDLKDCHRKYCPWPITPCPETFVRMTALPKEDALNQFIQKVKSCLTFKDFLPEIAKTATSDLFYYILN
ncbi:zinc finger C3HC-type protein 1-like [Uloborus diversus]|uniref:zinc finger C3HC-type protein 1-like n=1 Tax=Uloborus diversus TaxID=327109 RepID=UPI00240A03F2|nr:zinc finger C3HC-type protein 1-like [Uloborus diversus]